MQTHTQPSGRAGKVVRVLAHGTVMIWDIHFKRSYPFYRAGEQKFRRGESVRFKTDATDTVVTSVRRISGSGTPKQARVSGGP